MAMVAVCEVEKLKAKIAAAEFRCLSKPKIESYSVVWTLKNMWSIRRDVGSKIIPRDGRSDILVQLKPNGFCGALQVSVKLLPYHCKADVDYELRVSLVNPISGQKKSWFMMRSGLNGPLELDLVTWQDLWEKHVDLICDRALTLLCEIKIVSQVESMVVEKSSDESFYGSQIENLLDQVFAHGQILDARLKFGGSHISVNMGVLSARSPVFQSLFADIVKEEGPLPIEIDFDCKGVEREVLEEMIRFMYTGKPPAKLEKLALQLMRAADKFKVATLKKVCADHFRAQLHVDNAIATYMAAKECSAVRLKAFTMEFIRFHMEEVLGADRWKEAVKENEVAPLTNDELQI